MGRTGRRRSAVAWRGSPPRGTSPARGAEPVEVTVYQRGARLGGKAASSRGGHGRIEEHGLHVWLGHYDNAFRLLRRCYDELDRAAHRPDLPDPRLGGRLPAGQRSSALGDARRGRWTTGWRRFPTTSRPPGEPGARRRRSPPPSGSAAVMGLDRPPRARRCGRCRATPARRAQHPGGAAGPALGARVAAAEAVRGRLGGVAARGADAARGPAGPPVHRLPGGLRAGRRSPTTSLGRGYGSFDDEDLADWLRRHGVTDETLQGPFVQGLLRPRLRLPRRRPGPADVPRRARPLPRRPQLRRLQGRAVLQDARRHGRRGDRAACTRCCASGACASSSSTGSTHVHLDADRAAVAALTFGRQVDLRARASTSTTRWSTSAGSRSSPSTSTVDQVVAGPELHEHDLESPRLRLARRRRGRARGGTRLRPGRAGRLDRHAALHVRRAASTPTRGGGPWWRT